MELGLRLWRVNLVAGGLESEGMSRGRVPVLGSSNVDVACSSGDLRGLEGKIRALLVELSVAEPVGKVGTSEFKFGACVMLVEGTLAKLEGSLRTLDTERSLRCLNLVSDSSSSAGEGAAKTCVATSETSSAEASGSTVAGNRSASYRSCASSSSKEASSACSEGTETTVETGSETTSAAISTE